MWGIKGAQEGGPEQVSNHPLIQAGLVMGIRSSCHWNLPTSPRRYYCSHFAYEETEAKKMAQTGEPRSADSRVLFVCGSLPPVRSWGRGTNSPRNKGSLRGHGVVLTLQTKRRRQSVAQGYADSSGQLECQALVSSLLQALCRPALSGRGLPPSRPLPPPAPARLVSTR